MSKLIGLIGWFKQDGIRLSTNPIFALPKIYSPNGDRCMFSGVVIMEDDDTFAGYMNDDCGQSAIDGRIVDAELIFEKQYLHRKDKIQYKLRLLQQQGMHFKGGYEGTVVGRGDAQISLVTLPEKFLE